MIGGGLVTGLAGGHRRRDRAVTRDAQCRAGDVGRTDVEASGIDVRRVVASRAVAIEGADRECDWPRVEVILMLANVPATAGPWQLRQSVTPMWVPVTEYWEKSFGFV